jgi:hypothetical protein
LETEEGGGRRGVVMTGKGTEGVCERSLIGSSLSSAVVLGVADTEPDRILCKQIMQ